MVKTTLLTAVLALLQATSASPRPPPGRPDGDDSDPCFPSDLGTVGGNADESLPPCYRRGKIMEACGVGSNDGNLTFSEMQECVCDGSFFEDTIGCGACLNYQDLISGDDYDSGSSMIMSASSAYCDGTKTADLESLLGDIIGTGTGTFAGQWAPSEAPSTTRPTAVSNYFTATAERLGPGLESLVSDATLTGEAPTSEPTDDAAGALGSIGLEYLCLIGGVVGFVLS